jgi:hypothetical protein
LSGRCTTSELHSSAFSTAFNSLGPGQSLSSLGHFFTGQGIHGDAVYLCGFDILTVGETSTGLRT